MYISSETIRVIIIYSCKIVTYYTHLREVVSNKHMTSSTKKLRISAVDQDVGHNTLCSLRDLQEVEADNRNTTNHRTWEIWE